MRVYGNLEGDRDLQTKEGTAQGRGKQEEGRKEKRKKKRRKKKAHTDDAQLRRDHR